MTDKRDPFDFWYAVNNTEIVSTPSHHLETFGSTVLNYHLVSQLMDSVNRVRVRQGRMQAHQPKIITPEAYSETLLEGFGEEAQQYIEWLREHETDVKVLQYGYRLKQEAFSEQILTDDIQSVVEKVKADVEAKNDPLSAIIIGVDSPWDVCLVKLFWQIVQTSAGPNLHEMTRQEMLNKKRGIPKNVRREIDESFLAASRNPSLVGQLAAKLQQHGLFEAYQDRFFSLVRSTGEN
jgi:hypothetical protein